jgi:hypothetical protein
MPSPSGACRFEVLVALVGRLGLSDLGDLRPTGKSWELNICFWPNRFVGRGIQEVNRQTGPERSTSALGNILLFWLARKFVISGEFHE